MFLISTYWADLSTTLDSKKRLAVIGGICATQLTLLLIFKLYFFKHVSAKKWKLLIKLLKNNKTVKNFYWFVWSWVFPERSTLLKHYSEIWNQGPLQRRILMGVSKSNSTNLHGVYFRWQRFQETRNRFGVKPSVPCAALSLSKIFCRSKKKYGRLPIVFFCCV